MVDRKETLQSMTQEEKLTLLAGHGMWNRYGIERLNIRRLKMSDGPNGVRGVGGDFATPSASFPVGMAMGATWNVGLISEIGKALAEESKAKGAHILLGPTVNMPRSPLAGRNFECFSEDPYLTSELANAYIRALQKNGVSACIKHFVCNDQETERKSISVEVDERPLREIYLFPFERAVKEANVWAVMSAYNKVRGTWVSESPYFLEKILREEWQFDGLVISDWYGTYSPEVLKSGPDIEMPGPARWMDVKSFSSALSSGAASQENVGARVSRHLLIGDRVWQGEDSDEERAENNEEHRKLIRQAGMEAVVLLKNENELLPLDANRLKSLAVIGPNAKLTQFQGGGSSRVTPHYVVSALSAIENMVGPGTKINYAKGVDIRKRPELFSGDSIKSKHGLAGVLTAEFFEAEQVEGSPKVTTNIEASEWSHFGLNYENLDLKKLGLRISGSFRVDKSGQYDLVFSMVGSKAKLLIDGKEQAYLEGILNAGTTEFHTKNQLISLELEADREYSIEIEFESADNAEWRAVSLGKALNNNDLEIRKAVEKAADSECALIFAGLNPEWETEELDRPDMRLPKRQDELIRAVSEVCPKVIVILNAGSPVEMPWLPKVEGLLQMWYLGQESGNAIADLLFGEENPSGKLPISFPNELSDNPTAANFPGENGTVNYAEGLYIGYRHYDKHSANPLFPFGFGLSYTTFKYLDLEVSQKPAGSADVEIAFSLENVGSRAGMEIVQLYVRPIDSKIEREVKVLKAFQKVGLNSSQKEKVNFKLRAEAFSIFSEEDMAWTLIPGEYEILLAASSQDIRLRQSITVKSDGQ